MKTTGTQDCACVSITRPSAILDRCSVLDWNRLHVTPLFFVTVFKSLRFHLSTIETMRFQTSSLLKPFSKVSVFIGAFGRLVWTIGENASKSMLFQTKTHQYGWGPNMMAIGTLQTHDDEDKRFNEQNNGSLRELKKTLFFDFLCKTTT